MTISLNDNPINNYVIDLLKTITTGEGEDEQQVLSVYKGLQETFSSFDKPVSEVVLGRSYDFKYTFNKGFPASFKSKLIITLNTKGLTEQSETYLNDLIDLVFNKIIEDYTLGGLVVSCTLQEVDKEQVRVKSTSAQNYSYLYNSAMLIFELLRQ